MGISVVLFAVVLQVVDAEGKKHKTLMESPKLKDFIPDFIIAGAMKAGTSDLAMLLSTHDEVDCDHTEIHYWERCGEVPDPDHVPNAFGNCSMSGYANLVRKTHNGKREKKPLLCDKSPDYMYWSENIVPKLESLYPDAKIIVMLRDPVDRALSHFNFLNAARGTFENKKFDHLIEQQLERKSKSLFASDRRFVFVFLLAACHT